MLAAVVTCSCLMLLILPSLLPLLLQVRFLLPFNASQSYSRIAAVFIYSYYCTLFFEICPGNNDDLLNRMVQCVSYPTLRTSYKSYPSIWFLLRPFQMIMAKCDFVNAETILRKGSVTYPAIPSTQKILKDL